MNGTGIIVEYNPFHNGHSYHIKKAREKFPDSVIIGVMSGDFVQRGEPSIIDKWKKTEIALECGVDLVAELPSFYSTQSAEIFARGSVGILNLLKCKNLFFGSECGDIEKLKNLAKLDEDENFKTLLKTKLREGVSYPNAYNFSLTKIIGEIDIKSNDILAIQYIKALEFWNSSILPNSLKREKVGFYDENITNNFASATEIRKRLLKDIDIKELVTDKSYDILKNSSFATLKDFYPLIRYKIISEYDKLHTIQDIEDGYHIKLYHTALKSYDFDDFFNKILSKRYTIGRTQRILIHILLGLTKEMSEEIKKDIPYVRVLGFNSKGREYLNWIKKFEEKKIITSYKNIKTIFDKKTIKFIEFNERASEIYKIISNYQERKQPLILLGGKNENK